MRDVEQIQGQDCAEPDAECAAMEPEVSRRTFIKGVIATGASVSASSYVFRGGTTVLAQAPGRSSGW